MLDEADDQTWQDVDPGGDQCFDVVLEVPDDTQRCGYHQQNQRHNREYCWHSVGTYKRQRQRLTRVERLTRIERLKPVLVPTQGKTTPNKGGRNIEPLFISSACKLQEIHRIKLYICDMNLSTFLKSYCSFFF